MTPAEALTGPAIRAAMEAHAEACRVALREMRPTPEMPADLSRATLSGADLSGATLSGANLSGADLSRANLSWATLSVANLSGANLSGADLRWANLSGANLSWATLSVADLSGADLSRANLSWANLSGANLSGATLSGAGARVWIGDCYYAYTVPSDKGRLLAFGCERHTLDVWERDVAAMCKTHEPDHAARYEAEIRALIALCRVVDMEKTK